MQRVVVMASGLAMGLLAGATCFLTWDHANQVAGVVSAFVGIASLGTALWAAVASASESSGSNIRVSATGSATARGGGSANTGVALPAGPVDPARVEVTGTGDADAEGGQANTGASFQ